MQGFVSSTPNCIWDSVSGILGTVRGQFSLSTPLEEPGTSPSLWPPKASELSRSWGIFSLESVFVGLIARLEKATQFSHRQRRKIFSLLWVSCCLWLQGHHYQWCIFLLPLHFNPLSCCGEAQGRSWEYLCDKAVPLWVHEAAPSLDTVHTRYPCRAGVPVSPAGMPGQWDFASSIHGRNSSALGSSVLRETDRLSYHSIIMHGLHPCSS